MSGISAFVAPATFLGFNGPLGMIAGMVFIVLWAFVGLDQCMTHLTRTQAGIVMQAGEALAVAAKVNKRDQSRLKTDAVYPKSLVVIERTYGKRFGSHTVAISAYIYIALHGLASKAASCVSRLAMRVEIDADPRCQQIAALLRRQTQ